ncbi:Tic20 family protein [Scytonema sp. NUACC26]|uniref:Tic20 family protein n=1 Tax=Scytonema sp. NUACC26 TaxID=3140176 RepID=UPI0034DBD01D
MAWRGSTTVSDRLFACLPYLLPLIGALAFGISLFTEFPALAVLFLPLQPVLTIYGILGPYGELIIFFLLFFLVVRNERIAHFIRFNTMQALLLDIVAYLCGILLGLVALPGIAFAAQTLSTTIFLGIVAAVVYSVVQSLMGRYAEIPAISDAVYMQVR